MAAPVRHLVLVGAGHAHVEVLREFGRNPPAGLRLTLITREVSTPYSGMLAGFVAGHYSDADFHIDAAALAARAGGETLRDEAVGLDVAGRRVLLRDRGAVGYDVLSLDTGSHPDTTSIPGVAHVAPVKPIDDFLLAFGALLERARAADGHRIVMVGGGAGGVELLLAVERRLRRELPGRSPVITLVTGGPDILPGFPAGVRARFRRVMAQRGIALRCGHPVVAAGAGGVKLADGGMIGADEILWATQAAPPAWLRGTGLALDPHGFLRVDAELRAVGHPDIFAAGDMVAFDPRPIPRSGVYAVRAGPVLAHNLRAVLDGSRPRPYRPQRRALYIMSTGDRHAIATRNGLVVEGDWVWRVKDRIDRRFIARYQTDASPSPLEGEGRGEG